MRTRTIVFAALLLTPFALHAADAVPSCRSGGIQHLALTAGIMFHRSGCRRALLKLLFTDYQQIHRHKKPLQNTPKPDHLLIAV